MKRWGIIITLAYVLLWLGLAYPVWWLALEFDWGYLEDGFTHDISHGDIFEAPLTWIILSVLVVCQMALLLVPVGAAPPCSCWWWISRHFSHRWRPSPRLSSRPVSEG